MSPTPSRFDPTDYDAQWALLGDFVRFNPGARHRRRLVLDSIERLPLRDPLDVLDVGCGLGEAYVALSGAHPGVRYHGVDSSRTAIDTCAERHPTARWTVHDVLAGPLDERHQLVLCSEVTEHVDDPESFIRSLAAMTEPGGYLVLTTPNGKIHTTERAVGHVHHPRRAELVGWLERAGFVVRRLLQWGWPAYTVLKYAGDLAPGAVLDNLANGQYGPTARAFNRVAYGLSYAGSLPSTPWGPQFVVTAERR